MQLETPRLLLREYRMTDYDAVHRYATDEEALKYVFWGPNTPEETWEFLRLAQAEQLANPRASFNFAIEEKSSGRMIGGCGLTMENSAQAEVGWVLHSDYWNRGFMTEAAAALLRLGFETQHLHRIYATCDANNPGSYRVMEKNGMRREAHFHQNRPARPCFSEKWHDGYLYAILEEEWTALQP